MSYAASVRLSTCYLVVAVTIFVVNSMTILMAIGVRMTVTGDMVRTACIGRMTERNRWQEEDCSNQE